VSIYRACDIRGHAERELDPRLYRAWGVELARRAGANSTIVAGGDVRLSTPAFLAALVEGLEQGGARVANLGIVPTPLVYFAKRRLGAAGCAIVTASHNPPEINGLKWMLGRWPPTPDEVQSLEAAVRSADPQLTKTDSHHEPPRFDVNSQYRNWLRECLAREAASVRTTVVLDPGGGCWAGRAQAMMSELFPAARFIAIHDQPDGNFADRNPDSARPEHLTALGVAVRRESAGLGIAFDGDGDRLALVDGQGTPLSAEEATWVLLHLFTATLRARPFVYDLKFSDRIGEAARELGAQPMAERSGHAFIRTRMLKEDAAFGAEISGHYFLGELDGDDDPLFTAAWVLIELARSGKSLAEWRRAAPAIHATPDLRLDLAGRDPQQVIAELRARFADLPQNALDGVRIQFPAGWALVRSSVTEARLTLRFEGHSRAALTEILVAFTARASDALPGLADLCRKAAAG
jgi:phosphomannomutase/phosphoglucomutase